MAVFHMLSFVLSITVMNPNLITYKYPMYKYLTSETKNSPSNSDSVSFYLTNQSSWHPPGAKFSASNRVDDVVYCFFKGFRFKNNVFLYDSTVSSNNFFNAFQMGLSVAVTGLPDHALS
jgi:hypothetical protein